MLTEFINGSLGTDESRPERKKDEETQQAKSGIRVISKHQMFQGERYSGFIHLCLLSYCKLCRVQNVYPRKCSNRSSAGHLNAYSLDLLDAAHLKLG